MSGRGWWRIALAAWALQPGVARADVVQPPPASCPPGHEPRTSHAGPYCQPPLPTHCPAGNIAKVFRDEAYCEPPPTQPCPPGATWTSRSATDTYCVAGLGCPEGTCSQEGKSCVESSLCVRWRGFGGRHREAAVSGICGADGSCPKGEQCLTARRCADSAALTPPPTSNPLATPPEPPSATATSTPPAQPPPVEVLPRPADPPPGTSGCAGCSSVAGPPAPLPLAALALGWLARRRHPGGRTRIR